MRISDWSSDVCSSDLIAIGLRLQWKSPTPFQVWLGPPLKFAKEFPHESHRGQINRRPPRLRDHRAPAYAVELTMDLNHFYSQHQVALIRASAARSEEHTSELQSLMRISYAVFCLKKKTYQQNETNTI